MEVHSGWRYGERPLALWWEEQRLEITAVETEWRSPGGLTFRVRVQDGRRFELYYGEHDDEWRINPI